MQVASSGNIRWNSRRLAGKSGSAFDPESTSTSQRPCDPMIGPSSRLGVNPIGRELFPDRLAPDRPGTRAEAMVFGALELGLRDVPNLRDTSPTPSPLRGHFEVGAGPGRRTWGSAPHRRRPRPRRSVRSRPLDRSPQTRTVCRRPRRAGSAGAAASRESRSWPGPPRDPGGCRPMTRRRCSGRPVISRTWPDRRGK